MFAINRALRRLATIAMALTGRTGVRVAFFGWALGLLISTALCAFAMAAPVSGCVCTDMSLCTSVQTTSVVVTSSKALAELQTYDVVAGDVTISLADVAALFAGNGHHFPVLKCIKGIPPPPPSGMHRCVCACSRAGLLTCIPPHGCVYALHLHRTPLETNAS